MGVHNFQFAEIMGNLNNTITLLLIYFWVIGFFAFNAGAVMHILLVIAIVSILQRLIKRRKTV